MTRTELLIKLRELHEELVALSSDATPPTNGKTDSSHVDDETIEALGQLVTDANSLLDRSNPAGVLDHYSNQSDEELVAETENLIERAQRLESEHPVVAQFVVRVTDLLNSIGI